MSVLEATRGVTPKLTSKQQKKKKKPRKRRTPPPLSFLLDTQVLTYEEWCRLNRFSVRQGRRILRSGAGPAVVQLSKQRIGVTVASNRKWQEERSR
jgi:hypothetical protein